MLERLSQRGIAIPVVVIFCALVLILALSTFATRTSTRRQTLSALTQRRAYYMAMGGVQHALLKVRMLSHEAYQSAALARGVCPFYVTTPTKAITTTGTFPNKTTKAMASFLRGLGTDETADPRNLKFAISDPEFPDINDAGHPFQYEVQRIEIYNYYSSDYGEIREVAHIEVNGQAYELRDNARQEAQVELVKQKVELKRGMK